jgi:general L-amino acid transport system substrate-binding protein
MNKKILSAVVGVAAVAGMGASSASAATLDDVKAKGFVQCGVSTGLAGFSAPNDAGDWSGIDVDLCRGVAAAVFGDAYGCEVQPAFGQGALHRAAVGRESTCFRATPPGP